ncbi:MAG: hypothetical protein GQ477_03100 [Nanohaloarchaea archaeon]|nr:hypothetical protein [Candidatus Nanohaloarchaea archaeon]
MVKKTSTEDKKMIIDLIAKLAILILGVSIYDSNQNLAVFIILIGLLAILLDK